MRTRTVNTVEGPATVDIPTAGWYRLSDGCAGTQWLTVRTWYGRIVTRGMFIPPHPDDLGPIGGRGDTWGVHWGYTDYLEGVPWNAAGALDRGRAYRRALEQLERFGEDSDPVAVRIGPLAERGSALAEITHETTGTLAEVRAQVICWRNDYRAAAAW